MKEKLYDLTAPQKSILVTEQYFKGSSINHICGTAFLYEKIDFDVLEQALNLLVKYNDSLRIRMVLEENEMKQTVNEYIPFNIETVEVSSKDEVSTIEANLMKEPFDMYSNLFTCKMFRMPDGSGGFSVNIHHLVSDSWTLGLVAKEVVRIYSSIIHHEEIDVSSISSYVDYISAEQEYRASDKFKKDKAYWDSVFENIPESASIPSSKEDADSFSCKANRLSFTISKKEMEQINTYCKDAHISAFNFFMGLYAIYTSRVSGIEDFVMGTPILNRTNFKEKNTMGMFINVVPLRLNLTENLSFGEFASRIAKSSFEMMRHQKYSYQYILEDLRKKDASLPNLYHILMSYQITKASEESGVPYDTRWAFNGNVNDDLEIHLYDLNDTGCIDIAYDYRTDKYEESEIRAIHERMLHMIHQVINHADMCINDIEIVTSKEKYEILYGFNDTDADYPKDKTIVDLFEEQVIKTPNRVAVTFENQTLTYQELNEKSNQLAHYLIHMGIKPNDVIALRMPKCLEMIIGILGIMKAGATYLPINLSYPQERVDFMLQDSNASYFLYCPCKESITISLPMIDISLSNHDVYSLPKENLTPLNTPDDVIYIIYTSGSTGTPKGAMLMHKNVVRLLKNDHFQFDFNEHDVWTMFHSVAFDFSVWEMYGALLFGGKLVLVPEDVAQDPNRFLTLLREEKVTVLNQTPTYFYNLLNAELKWEDSALCVRYIIYGGEALKPSAIKPWKDKYPFTRLINMYGITETTVHVTFKELLTEDLISQTSNIGTPIPTLKVFILDKYLHLLPFGIAGEICVSGAGVFKGYLNRPELNHTKLIQNPYHPDEIMYRSGDSAILHANGTLEYCGRIDSQIKIRGFRIELGEIEEKLLRIPHITSCVVAKKTDEFNHDILCAYYVKSGDVDIAEVKSILKKDLAQYMIPQYFIELEHLPYNHNGKINRNALPLPSITSLDKKILPPRNEIDTALIAILKDILHVNTISIDDSFLELGGDSLSAINFCTILASKLGMQVLVKDVLSRPVISDLSDFISSSHLTTNAITIEKAEKANSYPLSSAQKRIYYATKMAQEDSLVYNIPGALLVDAILDKEKIKLCFNKLLQIHSSFRTCFKIIDGEPRQVVLDDVSFDMEFYQDSQNNLELLINSFPKAFDLSIAPLLRVAVYYLDNQKTLILLDSHHIIMDGTSLNIFVRDFCTLYNDGEVVKAPFDYIDYSVWENSCIKKKEFQPLEDFWVNQFKNYDIPTINLPYDFPVPAKTSYEGNRVCQILPQDLFVECEKVAKELGVSNYMFFLAIFYILLYKYTSQNDIIVGSPIAGRFSPDLANMIGMFVNNLTLPIHVDSSKMFTEFLQSIKDFVVDAMDHQPYPYDLLVENLNLHDTNLFDVMFIYQNMEQTNASFNSNAFEIIPANTKIAKFNLSLEIMPQTHTLYLEYRTDLFKKNTIERMLSHYVTLLYSVLHNVNANISNLSILSEREKHQILYEFNDTKTDYPSNKTIAELFEEQVNKTPNHIAVVFEEQKLTYQELNEKANQLARFLLANQVIPSDIVCLLLDKSLESIIAIIAILKIGATYLPIDIDYPVDRIDYIIRDSNSKLLLTTKDYIHKSNGTIQTLCIDFNSPIYNQYSYDNIDCEEVSPDSLSYIMYTSGSTGKPKGVMVKHKNIIRLVKNNNFITFHESERILQTGSIVFDACTFEIFGALLNGFELYIIKKSELLDASLLQDYLIKNNITTLWLTAPLFNQLCEENPHMFRSVKTLLTGGDVLSPKHINMVRTANPNLKVINGYGPTENTTFSCCFTIDKEYANSIPIGKPISNSTAYVVSSFGQLNPIGIPGELWVGGDGVAKGYLNNYGLTKEKFIQNPFGDGLLYKTGDLVKWLPDGNIEFIGRIDNQVKIRGFRVELGEINTKISTFPSIKECVTIANTIHDEKCICSYIVADKEVDIQELKQYLRRNLPVYMIPTYFMQLEKLPINTNGKIDRKLLPTNFTSYTHKDKVKLPTTEEEKTLLDIFKSLLSFDNIGIDDDFFELGGNSLLAIKLQIEAVSHNLPITYADIFEHHTVEELVKNMNHTAPTVIENFADYEKYNTLLASNQITENMKIENTPIGNVLLTGFTGFLGAHVLDSFIKKETGTIYCLIRGKNHISPEDRLKNVLHFYFDTKYDKYLGNRIKLVEGDITLQDFGLNMIDYNILGTNIDTVIHCAALVKHYGSYHDFEKINIIGTKRVIDFSNAYHLKLLHVSTISVSGNNLAEGANIDNHFEKDMVFDETNFYIGQNLKNFYVRSKFEAEKLVLDAISNGLKGCILRMGNLTSRFSEGKFQQNHFENAFVNRLKSFLQIGVFPQSLLHLYCEFTPIDYCGDAIIDIANHMSKDYTVFHLLNEKQVYLDRLFNMLHEIGIDIHLVSDEEFSSMIQSILKDSDKKQELEGIINDLNADKKLIYQSQVLIQSNFTKEFLMKIGFEWPYIDINYIRNYFKYLIDIGYFHAKLN